MNPAAILEPWHQRPLTSGCMYIQPEAIAARKSTGALPVCFRPASLQGCGRHAGGSPGYDHPVRSGTGLPWTGALQSRAQATAIAGPAMLRRGAWAVAAGRVALGLTALAWPSIPARPWVGATADEVSVRVFGRALGARDLALGAGALVALQRQAAEPGPASAWVAAGALSDALDVAASLSSWGGLPRTTRWLVVASAGGAALAGAAGALVLRRGRGPA